MHFDFCTLYMYTAHVARCRFDKTCTITSSFNLITVTITFLIMAQQAVEIVSSLIDTMEHKEAVHTIYDFNAVDIDGQEVSMSKYKGKLLLIINVASQ